MSPRKNGCRLGARLRQALQGLMERQLLLVGLLPQRLRLGRRVERRQVAASKWLELSNEGGEAP